LRRGVDLGPSDSFAAVYYAIYLAAMGRPDEAVTQLRRALETDPLSFLKPTPWSDALFGASLR
jgi:predicted Zn-dependent protease